MEKTELDKLILLLRRGVGIGNEIIKIIEKLYRKIYRAIDLSDTLTENRKRISAILKESNLSDDIKAKLLGISTATIAINNTLKPIKATDALINKALNIIMPDANISTNDMISRTQALTKTSVINYTQQAYNEGWTKRQLGKAFNQSATQTSRYVQTIANTAVSAVMNETKKELYSANDDLIDRVLFSATLDNLTSNICKSLDGKVFKLKDAPSLPLHPNERSVLLTVMKGEDSDEVLKDLLPRPNVTTKEFDKKTGDYDLKGGTSYSKDYESWLRKQPAYYQEDIIGIKASKEFRDGKPLKDVIKVSPLTEDLLNKAL